jgi:hypothetical protein
MVSGHTGNVVPRKGLRVRAPCPPLRRQAADVNPLAVFVLRSWHDKLSGNCAEIVLKLRRFLGRRSPLQDRGLQPLHRTRDSWLAMCV